MSDNGENIVASALDNKLNTSKVPERPKEEMYEASGKEGQIVSDKHVPVPESEPSKIQWTIREIERALSLSTLKPPRERIEQFTTAQHLKSDLRMKNLSRQMGMALKRDHQKEMTSGPEQTRVRGFDIESQTMRSITANAAMGSLQFQKNLVLPYMRKDLALGYQKVAILKDISTGITSMEKAIVSKLEAIKINTAAAVPRKQGYFKKLFDDVSFLNRRRVAQNISNYISDGYERTYKEIVTPRLKKLNERMQDTSATGGINGIRRDASGKLTKLLRSVRDVSSSDTTDMSKMGKAKVAGAKVADRFLGATLKGVRKIRLGKERNRAVSELLQRPAEDIAGFNPFALPGVNTDLDNDDIVPVRGNKSTGGNISNKLLTSFNDWRKEYRRDQDNSLEKLAQLSESFAGCCEDAGVSVKRKSRKRKSPTTKGASPKEISSTETFMPETLVEPDFSVKEETTSTKPRSFFSKLSSLFSSGNKATGSSSPVDRNTPDVMKPLVVTREDTSKAVGSDLSIERNMRRSTGSMIPLISKSVVDSPEDISPNKTPIKTGLGSAINLLGIRKSTESLQKDAEGDRAFVRSMFNNLGEKILTVTESVQEGNKQRSWFEKLQEKWKETSDRLTKEKTRKNSYEDLQAQRQSKQGGGLWDKTKSRAKMAALGIGGNLAQGQVAGAALEAGGQVFDWGKEIVSDAVGEQVSDITDKAKDKIGDKTSRAWRKAKLMRTSRGRRLARSAGRTITAGGGATAPGLLKRMTSKVLGRGTTNAITQSGGSAAGKGLLRRAGGAALGLTGSALMGASKLGLKGAKYAGGKSLSLLGKGGLKLAKGLGPGLAVALGADAAHGWLDKNTSGTTERLGKTAATAASWGATGAGIGSMVPILGTGIGAAVGAGAGALYENTDLIRKGLAWSTNKAFDGLDKVGQAGAWTWKNLFGSDAKFDKAGRVKEKETPSIIGHVKTLFFGSDAKYAKSGDIVSDGKTGIVSELRRGFDLFFFGIKDPKEKDKFKPGSSMLSKLTTSFFDTIDSFRKTMADLPKTISDSLKGLGSGISDVGKSIAEGAGNVVNGVRDYWNGDSGPVDNKDVYKGKGTPVPDAKSIVESLIPGVRVTSHRRPAGGAGKAGSNSWHVKSGAAVDVAPISGMSFGQFKKTFLDAGYSLIEAIDETNPETMKKTGATGPHWHLVLGNKTNVSSSPYTMTPKAPETQPKGKGAFVTQTGKTNKYAWADTVNPTNKVGNPSSPGYARGTGAGSAVPGGKSAKERFVSSANYLTRKGYTKVAAVGITANLFGESELNPLAFNSEGGGNGAKGIAQWRGQRIKDIEQKWGKPIDKMSLQEQLDAVDNEIREGKHVTSSKALPYGTSSLVEVVNKAPNVEAVVQQMVHRYERPSNSTMTLEEHTNKRIAIARSFMGDMGTMGTNVPKAPEKNPVARNSPVTETQKATVPKPKTSATAKPKEAAPANKPTKTKEEFSLFSTMNETLSKIGGYFEGEKTKKTDASKGNTVVAPITVNKNTNVAGTGAYMTMSMAKTSVRTGM